jgi:hypothetical protein
MIYTIFLIYRIIRGHTDEIAPKMKRWPIEIAGRGCLPCGQVLFREHFLVRFFAMEKMNKTLNKAKILHPYRLLR